MKKLSFRYSQVLIGLLAILAMVTFSFRPYGLVHASPAQLGEPPANEVAIKLKAGIPIGQILTRYGATLLGSLPENNVYFLQLANGQTSDQILPALNADTDLVKFVGNNLTSTAAEVNYYAETMPDGTRVMISGTRVMISGTGGLTPTPAGGADQWAWQKIALADAQKISTGVSAVSGQQVIVAVLDTGMVGNHPLSQSNITAGYDFINMTSNFLDAGNGIDDDGNGITDDFVGHGTHVSGIIVTTAPNVRIMPIRVLNSDGVGTYWEISQGIRYAVDHGANIINMSLTAPRLVAALSDALAYAAANGVIVIAASGNNDPGPNYPAHYNDPLAVITVGATDRNDAIASFSGGLASDIDVFAPGVDIYSSYPYNGFALGTGTSMAAPIVAGEAALLIAKHPDWSATEIKQRLMSTGATVSGSSAKRINMATALTTGLEINAGTLDPSSSPTDGSIAPRLRISNYTTTNIPLSEIKLRYWYTADGASPQAFACDYGTPINCPVLNMSAAFTTIASGSANLTSLSDTYAEISFPSSAGNLTPGTNLEMYLKIYKTDLSAYNELNDYSYLSPTKPVMTRWERITVYRNGTLVWGVEPTSSTILTRTPTRTPTLYVPTATFTKTATSPAATATHTRTVTVAAATATKTATTAAATATKTSTSAVSATKSLTPASSATRTSTPVPATATAATGGTIKMQLQKDPSSTDSNSSVGFYTRIMNTGTSAISNISARLYFTPDGTYTASQYSLEKYYDQCNGNIQGPTLLSGTTYYFTVTCSGSLAAGASWAINYGFHLADWSNNLNSTNDWWHTTSALPTTYTDWSRFPIYVNGTLTWGVAP